MSLLHYRRWFAGLLGLWALGLAPGAPAQTLPEGTRFVMAHFGATSDGGDERLYISHSPDGLSWTCLNQGQPVWQPVNWYPFHNVVRDPTILFANGFYWVAYTSGNYGKHASFGLVKSSDLITWSFVGEISTAVPGATDPLTWNPCFFQDGDGSIHLFVSISLTGGTQFNPNPGMWSYEMHPLNGDFTQWSEPVALGLPHFNTNEFWAWKEADTYHAVYIDFQQGGALIHATSKNLLTGWGGVKVLGYNTQEGPFVLPKPEGGYRLYLEGGNNVAAGYRFCDFQADFTLPTAQVVVTASTAMRNGKVTLAPATMSFASWQAAHLATVPAAEREPDADPDQDGLENLLECATGTDPLRFNLAPALLARPVGANTYAGLRPTRLPQMSDVGLQIESSTDLLNWETPAVLEASTMLSDGRQWVHGRSPQPASQAAATFLRVRARFLVPPTALTVTGKPQAEHGPGAATTSRKSGRQK